MRDAMNADLLFALVHKNNYGFMTEVSFNKLQFEQLFCIIHGKKLFFVHLGTRKIWFIVLQCHVYAVSSFSYFLLYWRI